MTNPDNTRWSTEHILRALHKYQKHGEPLPLFLAAMLADDLTAFLEYFPREGIQPSAQKLKRLVYQNTCPESRGNWDRVNNWTRGIHQAKERNYAQTKSE